MVLFVLPKVRFRSFYQPIYSIFHSFIHSFLVCSHPKQHTSQLHNTTTAALLLGSRRRRSVTQRHFNRLVEHFLQAVLRLRRTL